MPKDQKQKQKKLMKKRRKDKSRKKASANTRSQSPKRLVEKQAAQYPIYQCLINSEWEDEEELVRITLTRKINDYSLIVGLYLVDMLCLGVKDAHYMWDVPISAYKEDMIPHIYMEDDYEDCPLELAHQIIYQSIDFADKFTFKPHKDFQVAKHILIPRGELPEKHQLIFGQHEEPGNPLFVAGPYDNVNSIMSKLEKHAGPGNYDYLLPVGDPTEDMDMEIDDEELASAMALMEVLGPEGFAQLMATMEDDAEDDDTDDDEAPMIIDGTSLFKKSSSSQNDNPDESKK